MNDQIPQPTIQTFARSIHKEAMKYGFGQVDVIRLVNALMDCASGDDTVMAPDDGGEQLPDVEIDVAGLPVSSERLVIRAFEPGSDDALFKSWLSDRYGRHFVLSAMAAHSLSFEALVEGEHNHLGIITTIDERPIGALAFLNYDADQKRAELRKLIGDPEFRGMGLAEEATRLWIAYGIKVLELQKIYVSTLQTHISNIKLNEKVGFQVEGLLRDEVLIDGERHDVLRMGYCRK
ncbi:MAG: GNAT family protein [Woeseiaceae bacterium]|nr:GNAT family protein [Woeseiaceae bacterium]